MCLIISISFAAPIETSEGPLQIFKSDGIPTGQIVDFFNDLFDSVNGNCKKRKCALQTYLSTDTPHHVFWEKALRCLREMRFVHKRSKKPVNTSACIKN